MGVKKWYKDWHEVIVVNPQNRVQTYYSDLEEVAWLREQFNLDFGEKVTGIALLQHGISVEKRPVGNEIKFYFKDPNMAMHFKLAWG